MQVITAMCEKQSTGDALETSMFTQSLSAPKSSDLQTGMSPEFSCQMMEAFFVPHFVAGPPVNFR